MNGEAGDCSPDFYPGLSGALPFTAADIVCGVDEAAAVRWPVPCSRRP